MKTTTIETIMKHINEHTGRSAWAKGVAEYAAEILEAIDYVDEDELTSSALIDRALLNGADSWKQYSEGGCSLIYDGDIAERLCTPSELKRTRNGERRPNSREEWLDVQARALFQASKLIKAALLSR